MYRYVHAQSIASIILWAYNEHVGSYVKYYMYVVRVLSAVLFM